MTTVISNPPYNIRWQHPLFAQMEPRFSFSELPPESNANYAFILTAIAEGDKAILILPQIVLSSKPEKSIRIALFKLNLVEAVICCPSNMFEATSLPVCIFVLKKSRTTQNVAFVNLENKAEQIERKQRGQYGGASHTNRIYTKTLNVIPDEVIEEVAEAIESKTERDYIRMIPSSAILESECINLYQFFDMKQPVELKHRAIEEIVNDYNRVITQKNMCKLTINETLAKRLGLDVDLHKKAKAIDFSEINKLLASQKIPGLLKEDYLTFTRSLEMKFENRCKDGVSPVIAMIMADWKQHVYSLNQMANLYLSELKDAFLIEFFKPDNDFFKEETDGHNTNA